MRARRSHPRGHGGQAILSRGLACVALISVLAVGCGEDDVEGEPGLSGDLAVAGLSSAYPFARAAADQFQIENRAARITVTRPRNCRDTVDVVASPRAITQREARACSVDTDEVELPSDGGDEPVYVYTAETPPALAREYREFVAEHHALIAEAAADGRRALPR